MRKTEIHPMPEYFDRYINKCDDVDHIKALEISIEELKNAPLDTWKALGDQVYAPGKWTVKDMIQHIIDTDRVFTYRATAFARGEQDVMSFDEDLYALNAKANGRTLEDLLEEAIVVRTSLLLFYKTLPNDALTKTGNGFKGPYSVASIAFCMAGHQRWHFAILEERYYPLLTAAAQ